MQRRHFFSRASQYMLGALSLPALNAAAISAGDKVELNVRSVESLTVLTINGAIQKHNRGKIDAALDQLMYKQGIRFDRAYTFDLNTLDNLPGVTIHPTMEYDGRVHQLSGPRLSEVLNLVGVVKSKSTQILFHGIDGYSPEISLANALNYDYVIATRIDGQLLSIGGFGPLFAIVDADRIPELAQKPVQQRFDRCPWGLYSIEVVAG